MIRFEKLKDKAVLTIYGYMGGGYFDLDSVKNALHQIKSDGYKKMDIWIHSYGGDVNEVNIIHQFMDDFTKQGECDIYMPGVLAGMGIILLASATKRHMAENAFLIIKKQEGGAFGDVSHLKNTSKTLQKMQQKAIHKLKNITGFSKKDIKSWMGETEYWYDTDDCIQLGLVNDKFPAKTAVDISTEKAHQIGVFGLYSQYSALSGSIISPEKNNINNEILKLRYGINRDSEIVRRRILTKQKIH